MSSGSHPSSGRLGWLFAALLFGILAGGGIAWVLITRHSESTPVVIYQMPSPASSAAPDDSADRSALRRRHRNIHAAEQLPSFLEKPAPTPAQTPGAELAAGLDGASATESPAASASPEQSPGARQTLLVDGIAITRLPSPAPAASRPTGRVIYDANSTQVDDSITLAIEGLSKYIRQNGFALREDVWGGELITGEAKAISHQLFKGNDYWFSMGCSTAGSVVRVRLYDSDGNSADSNYWQHEASDGSYAAVELQCQHTGTYFIVVCVEKAPDERVPWGVVYAYR